MALIDKILEKYPGLNDRMEKAKTFTLPGFDQLPLYDVLVFFRNEIKKDVISVRAKSIAYTLFLALFPGIIFFFSLIPYIPVENLQSRLLDLVGGLLPTAVFGFVEQTIKDVVSRQRAGLLSLGFLFALFFSSNGVMSMMDSFDKSYSYARFVKRSALKKRWVAIKLTIMLFFLLALSMVLIVAGNQLLTFLLDHLEILNRASFYLFSVLQWIIIILLFFNTISLIYYYGPAVRKKFKFVSAGSTLATFLTILISLGFSYFVNNFGQYNKIYGSIGTIIALQIFIYLNSFALLIGFELNASIAVNKDLRQEIEENGQKGSKLVD